VLYIHGWKHTASDNDGDFKHFTTLISQQLTSANEGKKQVLGVYVGWNAKSKVPPFNWPPFDNLTFWSKETIADRIAQSATITKIIGSISSALSQFDDPAANQLVAIGHSFGARMLFSATAQSLISNTKIAHPGYSPGGTYKPIRGIASAVILLNPAFEAARYTVFNGLTRTQDHFAKEQLPLLLSILSKADWATKTYFPLGQWLGFYRSEREMITLGNDRQYQTHSLRPKDAGGCGPGWNSVSEHFVADKVYLIRDEKRTIVQAHNPFLVARTSRAIINGHNDIWNQQFEQWLFKYIDDLGQHRRPPPLGGVGG
jgi:hypothetical protein